MNYYQRLVRYGISEAHYAVEFDDGTFGPWKRLAGSVKVDFAPQGSSNTFYADNMGYYISTPNATDQITIEIAYLTDEAKIDLLGYKHDPVSGLLYEPVDAKHARFAFGFQADGNGEKLRGVRYGGTLDRPSETHATTTESVTPDTQQLVSKFIGKTFVIDGEEVSVIGAGCTNSGATHVAFDRFWNVVPQPGVAPGETSSANTTLATLTVGDLALSPEFQSGVTTYVAESEDSSVIVSATATDSANATVTVKNGNTTYAAGSPMSLVEGTNVITVTVENGGATKTYVVIITYGA